jgi:hypothetical protein
MALIRALTPTISIDVMFTLSTLKKNRRQVVIAALCHWTIFE